MNGKGGRGEERKVWKKGLRIEREEGRDGGREGGGREEERERKGGRGEEGER